MGILVQPNTVNNVTTVQSLLLPREATYIPHNTEPHRQSAQFRLSSQTGFASRRWRASSSSFCLCTLARNTSSFRCSWALSLSRTCLLFSSMAICSAGSTSRNFLMDWRREGFGLVLVTHREEKGGVGLAANLLFLSVHTELCAGDAADNGNGRKGRGCHAGSGPRHGSL